MSFRVETFGDADLQDALVVVAFPTTGSAAAIAGHYLMEHLELPLVGHIRSEELAGLVAIEAGRAISVVRIHGGEVVCRLEGKCPRLYVVVTEIPLPPPALAALGRAIVAWAQSGGARMVLVLEGVVRNEGDETPDVFCAGTSDRTLQQLQKTGIPVMERAVLAGIASGILQGDARIETGALLVEALRDHPDGRAAAALIAALARLLPDVAMDPKPLEVEAMRLEEEMRRAQHPMLAAGNTTPPQGTFI